MAKMPGHRTRTDNLIKLKKMNVVSIMAHQDDEMRCLGTMLKCRARGDQLHFITLTDGSGGFVGRSQLTRKEAAGIRHAEMTALYYRPWQFYNMLISAQEYGVQHKLLFGTDYPFASSAESIAGLQNINCLTGGTQLPRIKEKTIEDLLSRDVFKLLGIE